MKWILCCLLALLSINARAQVPMQQGLRAFLYVEPFASRVEFLERVEDWAAARDKTLPQTDPWTFEQCEGLRDEVEASLRAGVRLHLNGQNIPAMRFHVSFLQGEAGRTLPVIEGMQVPLRELLLGVFWEFPTGIAPSALELEWEPSLLLNRPLPLEMVVAGERESVILQAAEAAVIWHNRDRLPRPAALAAVPEPQVIQFDGTGAIMQWLGVILLSLTVGLVLLRFGPEPLRRPSILLVCVLVGGLIGGSQLLLQLAQPIRSAVVTQPAQADAIIEPLLLNVYRAFDQREQEAIYDVLALSADGPLLQRLYLEMIEALSLDGEAGARVNVSEFASEVKSVSALGDRQGFVVEAGWSVYGRVEHWGHSHMRAVVSEGKLVVEQRDGRWKITELEVLDQKRI